VSAARPPEARSAKPGGGFRTSSDRFVDGYLGYLLGQANHALYKDFDAHVRAAGLSSIEWRVLATLHDSPPLTVSQLAHEVLSKQPTVTKLVQRMGDQGWVSLLADPADQRRTMVTASAAGKKLVRPLLEKARAQESELLRSLALSEQAALKKLLAKLAGR
jgi:DNA-binding MarR family transcriptional regulator